MKLRAHIERGTLVFGGRFIKLIYPKGKYPAPPEAVIARNIGPRPWSECFMTLEDGRRLVMYSK